MMRRTGPALLVVSLFGSALVAGSASAEPCAPPDPPPLRFHTPVFVDQHRPGGEPVTVVAKDGSIIYSAHLGTTLAYLRTYPDPEWIADYRNQTPIWRSTRSGTRSRRTASPSRWCRRKTTSRRSLLCGKLRPVSSARKCLTRRMPAPRMIGWK